MHKVSWEKMSIGKSIIDKKIILASASQSRLRILQQAGLDVVASPAHIDEAMIKKSMTLAGANGEEVAMKLAELKGQKIARQHNQQASSDSPHDGRDMVILAADQLLILPHQAEGGAQGDNQRGKVGGETSGETWFDKPSDMAMAKQHLRTLRGRTHYLATALVMLQGEQIIWRNLQKPALSCWQFSDAFIDDYLDRAGPAILSSVGAYQLEGLGATLFSEIKGDYFSILGLPLLPLLQQLRLMTAAGRG